MDCDTARVWILRKIDEELSSAEGMELDSHLAGCSACMREYRILMIPRRIGQIIPAFEPGPYFFAKLRARIRSETQNVTIWQVLLGLSRRVVPAMAVLTLALLSILAYLQFRGQDLEVYQAYDRMLFSGDRPLRMVQGDVSDESVLRAIAEQDAGSRGGSETPGKK